MDEDEFQTTVLDGVKGLREEVKTVKTDQEKLLENYDSLDKETKKVFEDVTRLKNTANDQAEILKSLQKLQLRMQLEARASFADPIERLIANDEWRARLNGEFRRAVSKDGDLNAVVKSVTKALGEDTSPGSTLINDELAMEIYDLLARYGKWNTLGVRRLGTKTTKYPVKTARPVANFILTEGGQISDDSNKAGTSVSLTVEVIGVLLNVSMQLLQDAEFDVTRDVLDDFVEAFNYRLDWAAFMADGTADVTDGGMTGLFEAGTAATAASGNVTMETLDFEDVTKCLTTVASATLSRPGVRWWMHPQILVRMLHIKDSNGRPIFLTATEAPAPGAIGSILGYPVELIEVGPNTNSAGNPVAAFGDPQSHVVGIRQDFQFEASDHHRWDYFQRSFRGIGRAGVKNRVATGSAILTLAGS